MCQRDRERGKDDGGRVGIETAWLGFVLPKEGFYHEERGEPRRTTKFFGPLIRAFRRASWLNMCGMIIKSADGPVSSCPFVVLRVLRGKALRCRCGIRPVPLTS